jgi:hypothetical protein
VSSGQQPATSICARAGLASVVGAMRPSRRRHRAPRGPGGRRSQAAPPLPKQGGHGSREEAGRSRWRAEAETFSGSVGEEKGKGKGGGVREEEGGLLCWRGEKKKRKGEQIVLRTINAD